MTRRIAAVVLALLSAACTSQLRTRERVTLPEGELRAGMDRDAAIALLGPPSSRGSGGGCVYARRFYDVRPDRATIELAWRRPGRIVVAYLRGPIVTRVGVVETP